MSVPPTFTKKPSIRQDGADMVFDCEIEATPTPTVTWYRGDQKLEFGEKIQALAVPVPGGNKLKLSLIIKNVETGDSGTYKVEAKNDKGQMAASINLNLSGMMNSTDLPMSITNVTLCIKNKHFQLIFKRVVLLSYL